MNNKKLKELKKQAHSLKPLFQLGKNEITENFVNQILDYIDKHEIVKITILKTSLYNKEDLEELFNDYHITTINKIGNIITLYKEKVDVKTK